MNHNKYPITWALAKEAKKRKTMWLGFCGKTRHAIKIAFDQLTVLVVTDFFVDAHRMPGCEEAKRCLHFKCSLNRTSPETWGRDMGLRGKWKATSMLGDIIAPDSWKLEGGVIMP